MSTTSSTDATPDPRLVAIIAERLYSLDLAAWASSSKKRQYVPEAAEDIAAAVWAWLTEGDEL